MKKIPLSIKFISAIGLLSGVDWLLTSINVNYRLLPLLSGIAIIILSIGLLFLWNIVRIISIIFSILFTFFYGYLLFFYIKSNYHYSWGIALTWYFPVLLWSLLIIIFCNLPKINKNFIKNKEKK